MKIWRSQKTKGAISVFLIIITVPMMLFSAVLIDGSRLHSARAMTQEAADLAAMSTLSSYHQELKEEFGLFAMEDSSRAEEIYKESLNATLMSHGIADAGYSERIWEVMKTTLTGQKSYAGESFLNLYDFQVEENACRVEPMYCLAEPNVLENQMVEYAKFRGLYVMADRLGIFSKMKETKQQAEENKEASEVMEDKMDADQDNADADRSLKKLRTEMEALNASIGAAGATREDYIDSLKSRMEELRIENTDTEDELSDSDETLARRYNTLRRNLRSDVQTVHQDAKNVYKAAENAKRETEKAIERLEKFCASNQSKAAGNATVGQLLKDAEDNIRLYREEYLPEIQKILDDQVILTLKNDTSIDSDMKKILDKVDKAITDYIEVIEEMREEAEEDDEEESGETEEPEITEYYYYYLNSSEMTDHIETVVSGSVSDRHYKAAIWDQTDYYCGYNLKPELLDPSRKYADHAETAVDQDYAKAQSEKEAKVETDHEGEAERGEIEDAVYEARPSKSYRPGTAGTIGGFYDEEKLDASKAILNQGGNSIFLQLGETVRDDVLGLSYLFGTFKTRLTGVEKFSSGGMSQTDKDSLYMPKWRYAHQEGELDMRFEPKKERETVLRGEIEYLIVGGRSDAFNENAVYAMIYAERMANNMIALYTNKDVNRACHSAAGLAWAASGGLVPEPVFFWLLLTAWAASETFIEMDYLISGGYKIPPIKTSKNVLLTLDPDASEEENGLIANYGADENDLLVSYEDYLLLLLLLGGKEKRIMRSADLIEMNMKKQGQPDFSMAQAYTYIYADTEVSIRYLFGNVMPFQETYEEGGAAGRMKFHNRIYLGY